MKEMQPGNQLTVGEHSNKRDIFSIWLDVDEKHTIWLALGSLDKLREGESSSSKQNSIKYRNVYSKSTERERKKKNMKGCLCVKQVCTEMYSERGIQEIKGDQR